MARFSLQSCCIRASQQHECHIDIQADTRGVWLFHHNGSAPLPECAPIRRAHIAFTMHLIARFVVLMVTVFGVSLAFAWAWDKSDSPQQIHGT
jgi:hypothetical protein